MKTDERHYVMTVQGNTCFENRQQFTHGFIAFLNKCIKINVDYKINNSTKSCTLHTLVHIYTQTAGSQGMKDVLRCLYRL